MRHNEYWRDEIIRLRAWKGGVITLAAVTLYHVAAIVLLLVIDKLGDLL